MNQIRDDVSPARARGGSGLGVPVALWVDEARPVGEVVGEVRLARELGYDGVVFSGRFGWDPLSLPAVLAPQVPDLTLATAIVSTWTRHPLTLAAQALTAQAASGGRVQLGVGPSHQAIVEGAYGLAWDRPARRVREYLEVLRPLLNGEEVAYEGETVSAAGTLTTPGATPPPLLLSAHGPVLLGLAGELADGVLTTWTTPRGVAEHIVPPVAAAAGPRRPQVVVSLVATLTDDPDAARERVATTFAAAESMPTYARALERDGLSGLGEVVVAGDERAVEAGLRAFVDAGATELQVIALGTPQETERTRAFIASL